MKVEPLSWDSAFFNLKIGELVVVDTEGLLDPIEDDFDLIYVKCVFFLQD